MNALRLLLSLVFMTAVLRANQPGMLDMTFKSGGGMAGHVNSILRQKDGKILLGGFFSSFQGVVRPGIVRLLSTGKLDLAFNPGSGTEVNHGLHILAVQPDGKILAGGDFNTFNGVPRRCIVRLLADGSVDSTFNPGTGATSSVYALAVQPDGKILLGGTFNAVNDVVRNRIARLNSDGSVDPTFNIGTGISGSILAQFVLQPDGKIFVGGSFNTYNGTGRNNILRLNPDGSLDTTFNPGTGASSAVLAMGLMADGRIVVGGNFTAYNGTSRNRIMRLNADGALDTTFSSGTGAEAEISGLGVRPDGKVVIGGAFSFYNGTARQRVARLNADGSLDTAFVVGSGLNTAVYDVAVQPDGKALVGGAFSQYNGSTQSSIVRINQDGKPDPAFKIDNVGADDTVNAVGAMLDGRIYIGGNFTRYGALARKAVARLKADGSVDPLFDPGTGPNNQVLSLAALLDGRVLIGGDFTSVGGVTRNRIARLNANGSLDTTFEPGAGADGRVQTMVLQPDGKILIGGTFTQCNGTARSRIARLNADGSLDITFNPGAGADNTVASIALQANGQVVISGSFTNVNGSSRPRLARLNSNGSLDMAVAIGTGADGTVNSVAVQTDGKVVIGGVFANYNGTARARIARVNMDGSLDTSFVPGAGSNNTVNQVALQPDGRILVAGAFTQFAGMEFNRLVRLNVDGSVDTGFNPGTGTDASIISLAVQPDGRLLIGGDFNLYDGRTTDKVGRVMLGYVHAATTFTGITQSSVEANAPLVGNVSIQLAKTGLFTGSLTLGIERIAFTGAFDREGRSLTTATRKNRSLIHISLALGRSASGGALVEGRIEDYAQHSATLLAYAPFFSSKMIPANHYLGKYPVALSSPPPGWYAGALPPSGAGFIICSVGVTGKVTVAGKSADGSRLTASVNLAEGGGMLLHFPLYKSLGFINGPLTIDQSTLAPIVRPVSGSLIWQRPAGSPYPAGFRVELTAEGSKYDPVIKTLPPFGSILPGSVSITVAGGHIDVVTPPSSSAAFALSGKGTVQAGGSLTGLTITVNRTAGTFAGTFIPSGLTKAVKFEGVITRPGIARGYALVNAAGSILPATVTLEE